MHYVANICLLRCTNRQELYPQSLSPTLMMSWVQRGRLQFLPLACGTEQEAGNEAGEEAGEEAEDSLTWNLAAFLLAMPRITQRGVLKIHLSIIWPV